VLLPSHFLPRHVVDVDDAGTARCGCVRFHARIMPNA
jgi:hypothetical protein